MKNFKKINVKDLGEIRGGACTDVQRSFLGRTWWVQTCTNEEGNVTSRCRTKDDAYAS